MTIALPPAAVDELASACGVTADRAARAAVALLARRYTGRAMQSVRCPDGVAHFDLAADGSVHDLVSRRGELPPGRGIDVTGVGTSAGLPAIRLRVADQPAAVEDRVPVVPPPSSDPGELVRDQSPSVGAGEQLGDLAVLPGVDGTLLVLGCPDELAAPFAADLATLLSVMAADPGRSTADLLPDSAYERGRPGDRAALHGGPRREPTGWEPGSDTISTAFAAQVARHPDRFAVLADDGELTYRQLGSAVAATAAAVRAATGDTGGGRAALLCRHGATTVVGLLAALAGGRAYVPLEPSFPAGRLVHILADSDADVLLVDDAYADLARRIAAEAGRPDLTMVHIGVHAPPVDLDELVAALAGLAAPDDPAYLLYTSGSTGAPKAVVQSHRNVLAGVANHIRNFAITPADRTSVLTSFGYDMAVTDLFGAILSGAAAVPSDIRAHGLGHLARTIDRHGVTVYHSTPTVYRYLLAGLGEGGRLPSVRAVLLGGEEVTRHDVELCRRHFAPGAVFVNGYGTTEISFAAQHHLGPDAVLDHAVVPIGHPLDGIDVVLVDAAGRPACLTGEVVVRCAHVALGYHGQPELTASRFRDYRGTRAYWTGDVARRLPDGRLVFLGRADRLVKIRGYRVELGEVESRLAALPGVGHAAVVARTTTHGTGPEAKELIAYAVPAAGASVDPTGLRAALSDLLPDYMVPRVVVLLDALPMGDTGKLDLRALPDPSPVIPAQRSGGTAAGQPDLLEQVIAAAWCDALGVAEVDRHTAFFDLGGHSLLLALVQERLQHALGERISMLRLLEFPTVAGLATHLRAARPEARPSAAPAARGGHQAADQATIAESVDAPNAAAAGSAWSELDVQPVTDPGHIAERMRRRRAARQGSAERVETPS
ncbi:non-ribosomal peptide synthetase [Catellatospora sp. NPDC049133]|uniref:non-ribosomal peptide synthetase n=1 Tax=Catellatospora sp. NPDC049133 TaxID=3155499 RepID=UPI0033E43E4E